MNNNIFPENFSGTQSIYDQVMKDNVTIHDVLYPLVFGKDQYIGQFSDNSADELLWMAESLALPKGSKVLDVGSGRGRVAAWLASRFQWKLTGIDLAEIPVKQAISYSKQFSDLDLHFIQANIYDYDFKLVFDGIYGTGAFCHFNAEKLFQHCHTLLRPGGRIVFMERIRLGSISSEDWMHLTTDWCCPSVYTIEEYHGLLNKSGFTIEKTMDFSNQFRVWQERSVTAREEIKETIIKLSSEEYYQSSLNFAKYENDVTRKGLLGYACITAQRI